MPCYYPLQANFSIRSDGKKSIFFSNSKARLFEMGKSSLDPASGLMLPCGRCMGCLLERSRQWAVRIMHEAQMYDENCFLTLTFDEDHLRSECPDGSISKKHMQKFLKRLRQRFSDRKIRYFYCGEYGEQFGRPHYHLCLFNFDFPDKELSHVSKGFRYYTSNICSSLWRFGNNLISDLTFDSAAYVARYCTKKINGSLAEDHYKGRTPEFSQASLKPGIGALWLDKFGATDVFPHDNVVVNSYPCKPPRYYDKRLEKHDPLRFEAVKADRVLRAEARSDDSTHARLLVREKCLKSRFNKLVRKMESSNDF